MDDEPQLTPEAVAALERGQLIEAIKLLRQSSGLGLKESKEAVERYLAANPIVNEQFKLAAERAGGGGFVWVLLIIIALLVYLFTTGKIGS